MAQYSDEDGGLSPAGDYTFQYNDDDEAEESNDKDNTGRIAFYDEGEDKSKESNDSDAAGDASYRPKIMSWSDINVAKDIEINLDAAKAEAQATTL